MLHISVSTFLQEKQREPICMHPFPINASYIVTWNDLKGILFLSKTHLDHVDDLV